MSAPRECLSPAPRSGASSRMESPRRKHSRERALHPQEYLDTHHIPLYLNDVVTLLLRLRPAAPLDFIANYFAEVLNGTHVLLRDFAYISACPHSRWSFVLVIQDSFGRLSPNQELSAHDLLELLRLFCPDFPLELVVDACRGAVSMCALCQCRREASKAGASSRRPGWP